MKKIILNLDSLYPEIDYQGLMAQLPYSSHPRRKLQELQRKGYLLRIKKGFYVFPKDFIGREYSREIIANLLSGPSYLSLQTALSFYQLIPERVAAITSVTSQKSKQFETPVGRFVYTHLAPSLFPLGMTLGHTGDQRSYLIATPEKALMDVFTLQFRNSDLPEAKDIPAALVEDLRIDLVGLKKILNKNLLKEMTPHYRYRRWNKLVIDYLMETL